MKSLPLPFLLVVLTFASPAAAQERTVPGVATCVECHADTVELEAFVSSVHGRNACTSCHPEMLDLQGHLAGEIDASPPACVTCHKPQAAEHFESIHKLQGISCADCHGDIHSQTAWQGDKQQAVATCLGCHDTNDYSRSIHGEALTKGNSDSAACHDCHNLHAIESVSDLAPNAYRAFHTRVCLPCHSDTALTRRNEVDIHAVETFIESYHGKSYRLGFPANAAGCADCHNAHLILPPEDPASTIHPDNLVATCGQCHDGATPLFVEYHPHGDFNDEENYPLLFWSYVGMTGLLVVVFFIFWAHSLLWTFRGFVENRAKLLALSKGERPYIPAAHKQYLRFRKRHIALHLIVIISFLGLALTGLPLKFSNMEWAKSMMYFFGGVRYAGLLHRACAILTFYYFLAALVFSFEFLFLRRKPGESWLGRLFGPDSLMPNARDLRDIRDMFRWFLFRGPKPSFERWTYWEKFDFLAVFWGMFAIGGSGLLLWFPEFFGRFLPGWLFNIAIIIHSEEALLATGFIFTVHFFNTHGRPEKFPMDFVIFNGQISKEEFIEERADQWRRCKEEGVLEEMEAKRLSGVLYDFILKALGFVAVFTGLALTLMMFYAFVWG